MQCALNYSGTLIPDGFRLKHFSGWSLSQNEVRRSLSFRIYTAWLLVSLVTK